MKKLIVTSFIAALNFIHADDAPKSASALSADQSLQRLVEGNKRFVGDGSAHPNQTESRRKEVAAGQNPVAIVLTCADSRVSPEVVFDQGLGDLFVIRNAGHVLDDHTLGSIEYAVQHLNVPLIVVVGHEKCGAVKAAVDGGHAEGHIRSLVEAIQPALARCKHQPGDKLDNAVRANALRVSDELRHIQPILSEASKHGRLKVVGARYDLDSGEIEILK